MYINKIENLRKYLGRPFTACISLEVTGAQGSGGGGGGGKNNDRSLGAVSPASR